MIGFAHPPFKRGAHENSSPPGVATRCRHRVRPVLVGATVPSRSPAAPGDCRGREPPGSAAAARSILRRAARRCPSLSFETHPAGRGLPLGSRGGRHSIHAHPPAGALVSEEEITLTPVTSIDRLPLSGGLSAAVQLAPDGLLLFQAATLVIDLPVPISADEEITFAWRGTGEEFFFYPPKPLNTPSITLTLTHFSGYGAGRERSPTRRRSSHAFPPTPTMRSRRSFRRRPRQRGRTREVRPDSPRSRWRCNWTGDQDEPARRGEEDAGRLFSESPSQGAAHAVLGRLDGFPERLEAIRGAGR